MFEEIYNIFKLELDGEEFDTDDDALIAANLALDEILADREWKFLTTSTTFVAGNLTYGDRDNFDKILRIWYDSVELKRAAQDERFDTCYDYYVDNVTKEVTLITDFYEDKDLIVDYKHKPDPIELENTPIDVKLLNALIAYKMGLSYFRKDQDTTIYGILENKRDITERKLIDYDNTL